MDTNPPELPFLSNIGFMLTYKCTIACPHCIVEAGPHRQEEMALESVLTWIDQARAYRRGLIKGLALTGGEPFYNLANLARISSHGQALGFIVSVVTNAFWAATRDQALQTLARLPALHMVSISTDVHHQRFIPLAYIKNAVWAAKELGRLYNIAVCTDNEADPGYLKTLDEIQAMGESDAIRVSITFPAGRAQKHAHRFNYLTALEPTVSACSMASSPVVFPDGKVIACIGPLLTLPPAHPLHLGNLYQESLSDILDRAEINPILHTIRVWGPHKLVELLKQHGLTAMLPENYLQNCVCDACYKLLSDSRIIAALENILQDEEIKHTIAYGRLYYLHETAMAALFQLGETGPP